MPAFFDALRPVIARAARLERAVALDASRHNLQELGRIRSAYEDAGEVALRQLHASLMKQHFGEGAKNKLLDALLERHVDRWVKTATQAFSVAADSVPEVPSPQRATVNRKGGKLSIVERLNRETPGKPTAEPPLTSGGRQLYGRIRLKKNKTQFRISLTKYLQLLTVTAPKAYRVEFMVWVQRLSAPPGEDPLFFVTVGVGRNSCDTCIALNGRVLTRAAVVFATTRLEPVLFHPRCKHTLKTGGLRGITAAQYDPNRFGELITLPVLQAMASRGIVQRSDIVRRAHVSV